MLSKLDLLFKACAQLDNQGIVWHEERCLLKRHRHSSCQRCAAVCPNNAIDFSDGLTFAAQKCTGCGACVSVCPGGAFLSRLPSDNELSTLAALHIEHSGAVAFACEAYLKAHPAERGRVVSVQCIARCHEAILVGAVLQGAAKVSIIHAACPECPQHKVCDFVYKMADMANRLLVSLNYPVAIELTDNIPESVKPLPAAVNKEAGGMSRRAFFTAFKKNSEDLVVKALPAVITGTVDNSGKSPSPTDGLKYLPDKWAVLNESLQQLTCVKESSGFQSALWGNIEIAESCSGCGACAEACLTAALVTEQKEGQWTISLKAQRCTQCGLCKDICCADSIEISSMVMLDEVLAGTERVIAIKKQEQIEQLFEPLEERMTRLLGCVVKN